jgi:hypothetical protein
MAQELEQDDRKTNDLQPKKEELKDVEPGQQPTETSEELSKENKEEKKEGGCCGG